MIVTFEIDEKYIGVFEDFILSLPPGAVEKKRSLDEEISKRVLEYKRGEMETTPLSDGLDEIREKLVSRL